MLGGRTQHLIAGMTLPAATEALTDETQAYRRTHLHGEPQGDVLELFGASSS